MQTQNLQSLIQALTLTMGATQESVNQGEALLQQAQQLPYYSISLLMIVDDANNVEPIRQSAIVNLKTFLEKHWKPRNDPTHYTISIEEKTMIKNTIVDALARCVQIKKLRSQYEDLIYKLVAIDFPQEWPQLIQQIVTKLSNWQSYDELWGGLLTLRRATENFQFLLDEDRKPLEPLVQATFPILEGLMQKFLESYNEQTGILVKVILKIFHHSTHLLMPHYHRDFQVFQKWMLYLKTILSAQVPPELATQTNDTEEVNRREKTFIWTNKKWASRIALRLVQKYCNKAMVDADLKDFATHVTQSYAQGFMEIFYGILTNHQQFQGPRTCLFALKYLFYALRLEYTKQLLYPHLDKILYEIVIPRMQLTPRDDELWKNDPEEYIKRLDDFSISTYNLKNAANDLLQEMCKIKGTNGNEVLMTYLNHCQACFNTNIDPVTNQPLDLLKKEALLWGIETLATQIMGIQQIADSMELMLEKHILPEFMNPIGFLRARACQVFSEYGSIEFKNKNNVVNAVQGISKCILDKELPVRVAAAISFSSILQHKEAQDLIRPNLNQVLEIYIKLMDLIDNEKIVSSLESIVKDFQNEVTPYANQLVSHLATIFQKYCNKQNQGEDDSDDDGEAELAAAGCLEAIKRILNSPLNQEALAQIESALFPILNFALSEAGCDFINEALEILNLMVYKQKNGISAGLWFYYPVLAYIVIGLPKEVNVYAIPNMSEEQYLLLDGCKKDWGTEFVSSMLGSFRNFIQKGGDVILSGTDMFGNSLVQMIFKLIEKIYTIADNGEDDTDQNQVTTLLVALIENFQGKIDNIVIQIIDFCLVNFQKPKKTNRFKMVNIGVLSVCIWYNAQLAVNYLDSKGITDNVFQTILSMEKHYRYEWDINRVFYAFCSLYSLPQVPNFLIQNAQEITKQLIRLSGKILEMREEDESCDQDEQAEEDDADFKNTLNKLQNLPKGTDVEDDDDEDDEDYDEPDDYALLYDSPLENLDAILLFEKLILQMQQHNPQLYQLMSGNLTSEEQTTFNNNIVEARKQYDEWVKLKQNTTN